WVAPRPTDIEPNTRSSSVLLGASKALGVDPRIDQADASFRNSIPYQIDAHGTAQHDHRVDRSEKGAHHRLHGKEHVARGNDDGNARKLCRERSAQILTRSLQMD